LGGLPANTVSFSAYPNNTNNTNNGRPGTPDSDTSYNTALSSYDVAREDEDDFSEYTTNGAYTDGGDGFGTINGAVAVYDSARPDFPSPGPLTCPACGHRPINPVDYAESPGVVPTGGALASAASQGGMDALEELRLLKDQVGFFSLVFFFFLGGTLLDSFYGLRTLIPPSSFSSLALPCLFYPSPPLPYLPSFFMPYPYFFPLILILSLPSKNVIMLTTVRTPRSETSRASATPSPPETSRRKSQSRSREI
jgi:hypothetical protein